MTRAERQEHDLAVIHGRFQVLHKDHLRYLLAGKAVARHLVVGITNPEPLLSAEDETDPQRSNPAANPLSYYERYVLIRAAMVEAGVKENELSIVPFPINFPDRWRHYVPLEAVFLLTIYDEWGRKKRRMLDGMGVRTRVLWERPAEEKGLSGAEVRAAMAREEPWRHMIPSSAVGFLEKWGIAERIRCLGREGLGHHAKRPPRADRETR